MNPDFLVFAEVKLNPDVIRKKILDIHLDTIILLIKKDIPGQQYFQRKNHSQWLKIFLMESMQGRGRAITCEYDGFYLVNVYVPNAKNDLSRLSYRYESWDPDLLSYLINLREKKPVVLCGDLNVAHQEIDLANPKPIAIMLDLPTKKERVFLIFLLRFS